MSLLLINESVGELHRDNCTPSLLKRIRRLATPDRNNASKVETWKVRKTISLDDSGYIEKAIGISENPRDCLLTDLIFSASNNQSHVQFA